MTTALRPCRVRFACNVDSHDPVSDKLTGKAAITWRGVPVRVEFVLYVGANLVDSKTDISKVYFQIHSNRSLGALWVKEIAGSTLDVTVSEAEWLAGTDQHGTFELDETDMQMDLVAATDNKRTFYWVLHVVMTDGTPITVGTGQWTVEEDGAGNQLPVTPGTNWNLRQSPTTGLVQVQSPRTALWHNLQLYDPADGAPKQMVVDQTGEA